jgi:acyl transferase domain-containing protein
MAYNGLQLRQCASAAASGVNLLLHPETSAIAQKAGMLAPDGRCKALSAAADGYGRAEACGVLLLQQAAAAGTGALALLAGSAVNQDGRSSSLTAPNGPSQQEVMRAALGAASLAAADVTALSMHGTGTALGDPIEVGAAAALLTGTSGREAPLVLMASKSWIGHAEPAAGAVGLTHAQMAVTRALQPPVLHLGAMNPYVTALMERQPGSWAVPRQPAALGALLAGSGSESQAVIGVSAFAFQGTNAHALLAAMPLTTALAAPMGGSTAWQQQQRYWVAPSAHR